MERRAHHHPLGVGAENRKVAALDAGANDYVTKPFSMPELEARIRVVTRGRDADRESLAEMTLTCGALSLDLVHHDVSLDDVNVALTTKEFEVTRFLSPTRRQDLHASDDPECRLGVAATVPKRSTSTPTYTVCARKLKRRVGRTHHHGPGRRLFLNCGPIESKSSAQCYEVNILECRPCREVDR